MFTFLVLESFRVIATLDVTNGANHRKVLLHNKVMICAQETPGTEQNDTKRDLKIIANRHKRNNNTLKNKQTYYLVSIGAAYGSIHVSYLLIGASHTS